MTLSSSMAGSAVWASAGDAAAAASSSAQGAAQVLRGMGILQTEGRGRRSGVVGDLFQACGGAVEGGRGGARAGGGGPAGPGVQSAAGPASGVCAACWTGG